MHSLYIILVYLFPLAFLLHMSEEFFIPGGFPKWFHLYQPQLAQPNFKTYLKRNLIYLVSFIIVAFISADTNYFVINGPVIVCGIMGINAFGTHIIGAFKTHRYSPGMVTAIFLLIPISLVTYILTFTLHVTGIFGIIFGLAVGLLFEVGLKNKINLNLVSNKN